MALTISGTNRIRRLNLVNTINTTICGWARINTSADSFIALSSVGIEMAILWDGAGAGSSGNMVLVSYNGITLNTNAFASRPPLGEWFFFYMSCSGLGTNQFTGGWIRPAISSYVTATTTMTTNATAALTCPVTGGTGASTIANLKVWNLSLSQQVIDLEYRSYRPKTTQNLLLWAPLNKDTIVGSLTDYSGNDNHLENHAGTVVVADGPPLSWK